jgi:hypothetical protein
MLKSVDTYSGISNFLMSDTIPTEVTLRTKPSVSPGQAGGISIFSHVMNTLVPMRISHFHKDLGI